MPSLITIREIEMQIPILLAKVVMRCLWMGSSLRPRQVDFSRSRQFEIDPI